MDAGPLIDPMYIELTEGEQGTNHEEAEVSQKRGEPRENGWEEKPQRKCGQSGISGKREEQSQ